jgi:hypothetical protein
MRHSRRRLLHKLKWTHRGMKWNEQKWKSKSKSCYDRRSVSQYVVMSSSLWNPWPVVVFCLNVAVLSLWGALSDERSNNLFSTLTPPCGPPENIVHYYSFVLSVTCCLQTAVILLLPYGRFLATGVYVTIYTIHQWRAVIRHVYPCDRGRETEEISENWV